MSSLGKSKIFNTSQVTAILNNRKSQFREVVPTDWIQSEKEPIPTHGDDGCIWHFWCSGEHSSKYKVDDILYAKEACKIMTLKGCHTDKSIILVYKYRNDIPGTEYKIKLPERFYKKDNVIPDWVSWFGATTIPSGSIKEMARIFFKITGVRVEKLQDISLEDMLKEGINHIQSYKNGDIVKTSTQIKREFINSWNSKAKDGYKWEDKPYVFVYEFKRVEK